VSQSEQCSTHQLQLRDDHPKPTSLPSTDYRSYKCMREQDTRQPCACHGIMDISIENIRATIFRQANRDRRSLTVSAHDSDGTVRDWTWLSTPTHLQVHARLVDPIFVEFNWPFPLVRATATFVDLVCAGESDCF
jgi:hypothetical protein